MDTLGGDDSACLKRRAVGTFDCAEAILDRSREAASSVLTGAGVDQRVLDVADVRAGRHESGLTGGVVPMLGGLPAVAGRARSASGEPMANRTMRSPSKGGRLPFVVVGSRLLRAPMRYAPRLTKTICASKVLTVMQDLLYLERLEQAETLLKPQRIELLQQLAEPRSCTEVAARLGQTQQRVYYHVKRLVEQGLVSQITERRVHGISEGVYQATARAYWISPRLVGRIGQRVQRDEASLGYLLDLMEEVQSDVAALLSQAARRAAQYTEDPQRPSTRLNTGPQAGPTEPDESDLPSLGVSGEIRVRPDQRPEFLADLRESLQDLFTKYGGAEGDAFRLAVACYPDRHEMKTTEDDGTRQGKDR